MQRQKAASLGPLLAGLCSRARHEHDSRQVFGLTGSLLASASQFMAEPVLLLQAFVPVTAAGQFRILTGFPFQSARKSGHRKQVQYRSDTYRDQ